MNERAHLAAIDYWDGLLAIEDVPERDAIVITTLDTLFAAPLPAAARDRSLRALRAAIAVQHPVEPVLSSIAPAAPSGHFLRSRRQRTAPRTRPPYLFAAVAASLLLLLGTVMAYWGGASLPGHPEENAVIPAATGPDLSGWPMLRGNSTRNGVSAESGPVDTPAVLWSVKVGGSTKQSPVIADGIVYVGSSTHVLVALDAATGQELWRFEGDASLEMTPTVWGRMVYIPSANGTLYALDARRGALRWTFAHKLGAYAMPAVANGVLFAGSMDGTFYAIDAGTGETLWTFETGKPFQRPAAVLDGVVYAGSDDGFVYALDARDGSVIWSFDTGQDAVGMPTVTKSSVYIPQIGGGIFVIDRATGTLSMMLQNPGRSGLSSPAASDRIVVVGGGIDDPELHVFDASSGARLYSLGLAYGGPWLSAPAIANGVIYAVSDNRGEVMAADASSGEELWGYRVKLRNSNGSVASGPAIANGVLYISTDLGVIYALG